MKSEMNAEMDISSKSIVGFDGTNYYPKIGKAHQMVLLLTQDCDQLNY